LMKLKAASVRAAIRDIEASTETPTLIHLDMGSEGNAPSTPSADATEAGSVVPSLHVARGAARE
jgi:hypothetical protein